MKKEKTNSKKIIIETFKAFNIKPNMRTNPQIIKEVIEEFKLDDFKTSNKIMQKFFHDASSKPQSLKPMFDDIQKGLITKHPAVIEFAELALKKGWFKPSKEVNKAIHVTYVLEALTATMSNSHEFFVEVQDHYRKEELEIGFDRNKLFTTFFKILKFSHSVFGTAKIFAADPAMVYFRFQKGTPNSKILPAELKKMLKRKEINYLDYELLNSVNKNKKAPYNQLLRINIYEAGLSEYNKSLKANAICAHELCEDLEKINPDYLFKKKKIIPEKSRNIFYKKISKKNNVFPIVNISSEWMSLYLTWNMTFLLVELEDLDIIFPKLLIPSVVNADKENFLGTRFISLWLTLNNAFFRMYKKKKVTGPSYKKEMAFAWAQINKKYAYELAKRETHENKTIFANGFRRFFSHPIFNFMKLLKKFFIN